MTDAKFHMVYALEAARQAEVATRGIWSVNDTMKKIVATLELLVVTVSVKLPEDRP